MGVHLNGLSAYVAAKIIRDNIKNNANVRNKVTGYKGTKEQIEAVQVHTAKYSIYCEDYDAGTWRLDPRR